MSENNSKEAALNGSVDQKINKMAEIFTKKFVSRGTQTDNQLNTFSMLLKDPEHKVDVEEVLLSIAGTTMNGDLIDPIRQMFKDHIKNETRDDQIEKNIQFEKAVLENSRLFLSNTEEIEVPALQFMADAIEQSYDNKLREDVRHFLNSLDRDPLDQVIMQESWSDAFWATNPPVMNAMETLLDGFEQQKRLSLSQPKASFAAAEMKKSILEKVEELKDPFIEEMVDKRMFEISLNVELGVQTVELDKNLGDLNKTGASKSGDLNTQFQRKNKEK